MSILRRRILAAAVLSVAAATPAAAQESFPSKPIRIIVPYSPGGVSDVIARLVGEKLSAKYQQPVLVENKAGAGGAIGTDLVAKAPPDGYTLLLVSPGHAVAPIVQKGVTWHPVRDFRAIAGFGVVPNVFVVHPDVPAKNMGELVELARKSSEPLTYGTAGIGTSNHLSGELLAQQAGIKLTHVPYKGQSDAMNDLLSGRITMMPLTLALAMPHIKGGKLRALAVTTARRASSMPELPTVAEGAKLPNYEVSTWLGLAASAKVPDSIARKLSADVAEVLRLPDIKGKLETIGMEYAPQPAAEFDALVSREFAKWTQVMKQAGIQPQ